jgi:hypothetical protein
MGGMTLKSRAVAPMPNGLGLHSTSEQIPDPEAWPPDVSWARCEKGLPTARAT